MEAHTIGIDLAKRHYAPWIVVERVHPYVAKHFSLDLWRRKPELILNI
ncbi:hypothetical protein SAMN04515618_101741 [Collimonas sp. OK307]|nr:hypothetical protein SAMN04515618_101741 [Collimonas sp. OK307]